MKTMIMKKRKNWLTALLSMFVLASCSLEEDTSSFSTPDNFYQTKEQCLSALNSCYIPLNGTYNYTLFIATEACTDIMYINSGTLDSRLDISPAKPYGIKWYGNTRFIGRRCLAGWWNRCS